MRAISPPSTRSGGMLSCALVLILLAGSQAEREHPPTSCDYGLDHLWTSSLRNSPLTATPLFFDVDGDGYKDIVAPSFSGEIWAIHGESGHIVDNWPFYLDNRAFHSSPLVYDVNGDGIVEFLLSTTDAELLFIQTDNTLLHGETIKLPPLRVQRQWYNFDPGYLDKLAEELTKQINNPEMFTFNKKWEEEHKSFHKTLGNFTAPFSEYESRYGRHSDPLYSRHQPERRPAGLDPQDPEFVYVDPHILATPAITDTNGDGIRNELVIPVSYYFDPFFYGEIHNLAQLGGLEQSELVNFVAGGILVVDLNTGRLVKQKLLGITRASANQPGYILSTPTVVKIFPGIGNSVIIVGTVAGDLHMLNANTLENEPGFPVILDSISAQVAVADLFNNGALELVVGDNSGNVYCIDRNGRRVWELETNGAVVSSVRFVDLENDGSLEVVLVTSHGGVWLLHGQLGTPYPNYPIHFNIPVQASVALMHLNSTARSNALSIIVPTANTLYIVDSLTGCIDSFESENMFLEVQVDDVDPYNPGLELLVSSLNGYLMCFSSDSQHMSDYEMAIESWPGEAIGQNGFTHKSNSFTVVLPHTNHTVRDITGSSFTLELELYDNGPRSSRQYTIQVTVGRKYLLYEDILPVYLRRNKYSLTIPTPSEPTHAFLTVTVCNEHLQCDSVSYNAKFNLHFKENLKWFLALPFLSLCAMLLWLLRDAGFVPLPTAHSTRKNL